MQAKNFLHSPDWTTSQPTLSLGQTQLFTPKQDTHLPHPRILTLQTKTKPQTPGAYINTTVSSPGDLPPFPSRYHSCTLSCKHKSIMRLSTGDVVAQRVACLPSVHNPRCLLHLHNCVWWFMRLIPTLSGQTWDDQEFIKVFLSSLSYLKQPGIHETVSINF